jgi:hypothetical protein
MNLTFAPIIAFCWITFYVVWMIGALFTKRTPQPACRRRCGVPVGRREPRHVHLPRSALDAVETGSRVPEYPSRSLARCDRGFWSRSPIERTGAIGSP